MSGAATAAVPPGAAPDHEAIACRLADAGARYLGAPAEALQVADAALAELDDRAPGTLRASALHTRGMALAYLARYTASMTALLQALETVPTDQPAQRVTVLRGLAIACEQMSSLEDALDWSTQAVEAARRLGDGPRLAECLLSVGVVLSRIGQTEAGLQHFQEVLQLHEARGHVRGCLQAHNNIGIALKNLGRHDEAVVHVMQAMQMARELGDEAALAVAASNLGEPLWRLGRLSEARAALAGTLSPLETAGYVHAEIHVRILLGQLLQADGEPDAALAELQRALTLAERTDGRTHTARAHRALADAFKAAGRFEQALAHHEAYHAAERAQFNDDSARMLHGLQVRFELARLRHEAEVERLRSAELAALSRTDALTGLDNRRQLDDRLAHEVAQARRLDRPLALAMCDVDNFKRINDAFGHPVGDAVLQEVARLLRRHCRDIDMVARFGGEEFCIVFGGVDASQAERACEAARLAIAQHDWAGLRPGLQVTVSFGLADRQTTDGAAELLSRADCELYAAKQGGRNRTVRAR